MPKQRARNAQATSDRFGCSSTSNNNNNNNNDDDTRRFAIRFAFDGTTYQGFQAQPYQNTVQDQLEHRLRGLLKRHVRIIAWGRTDAGVHAQNAVATIDLTSQEVQRFATMSGENELDDEETKAARFLHSVLKEFACSTGYTGTNPKVRYGSISSKAVVPVPLDFDARYSALWKRYVYYVCSGSFYDQSPFIWTRYAWQVRETLVLAAMKEAASLLSSKEHNFGWMSVIQTGEMRDPHRKVKLMVEKVPMQIDSNDTPYFLRGKANTVYKITGTCDFFLYKMMRRIVAILVAIGQQKSDVDTLATIITQHDNDAETAKIKIPNELSQTAPAKGLCLDHIEYNIPI